MSRAIEKAIYAEIGASEFYRKISEGIDNRGAKEKFTRLAEDENIHRDKLSAWFLKLTGTEFRAEKEKLEKSEIDPSLIKEVNGAMEALDIAIDAESRANAFYLEQAAGTADKDLKKLYADLAKEEEGHYALLSAEKNSLMGGFYWFDMDSIPFMED